LLVRDAVVCLQVYKGLNIESGEVVAVKQVQLNVINAEQLDSASPRPQCIFSPHVF
jgi:hypothetical protein